MPSATLCAEEDEEYEEDDVIEDDVFFDEDDVADVNPGNLKVTLHAAPSVIQAAAIPAQNSAINL